MTCVWKGLLNCLNIDDFKKFGFNRIPREKEFVEFLKSRNEICKDIIWNDEKLTKQFLEECYEAIKIFKTNTIYNGYLCSTCDPFIILVSQIFKINIYHNYCGNKLNYHCKGATKTIKVKSNKGHFQKM